MAKIVNTRDVPRLVRARRLEQLVVVHLGFTGRLPVDGPRRPVVVRRARLGAAVVVRQDAELELWIFVQDLALRRPVVQVLFHELAVLQHFLQQRADLGAARGPRLGGENVMTGSSKLFERVSHAVVLSLSAGKPHFG